MAQAIVDPDILDGNIAEVYEKLDQLSKRQQDIHNHDYASLRISINTKSIFAESQKVCQTSRIIRSFINQRAAKLRLSKPNYNLMKILLNRIHTLCEEDMEMMRTIQTSFGILPKKSRDERQVVLATAAVTSLFTYFTTRQLVQMDSDEDSD